jgi:tetratricopeptide (TPR) repeat protein
VKPLAVALAASSFTFSFQTLSLESHSHPPPEKLGTVAFPTSCAPTVEHDFERAVALLHSFAYTASENAFREIVLADPNCAMAHWGIAMSLYHQLWSPPEPADVQKGRAELNQAIPLSGQTTREKQFIAAAAAYYRDSPQLSPEARALAYEEAMHEVVLSNPKDTEAQAFYALSLIATAPRDDRMHLNQKRAVAFLEPIFRDQPDHPGAAHYLIHAYDSAELAPNGLAAARAYSKIAPSAPHALHMPSHIFTRLGLWEDSIASNESARAAAHDQGDLGEELHAMDYLTYAYLQQGRDADAVRVVAALPATGGLPGSEFKIGYAATVMPVRLAIERHKWSDAARLRPLPKSAPHVAAIVYWARALAASRAGRPQSADQDIAMIKSCGRQLQAAGDAYWETQVRILYKQARAWQLAATVHTEDALLQLRQAADEEDAIEKLPVTPGPVVPAREQLGEMLLALNRPKEALQEFRAALTLAPGRRGSLTGAARSADLIAGTQTAATRAAATVGAAIDAADATFPNQSKSGSVE